MEKNDLSEEIPNNENPNLPQHHSGFISCIYTSKRIISGISVGRAANVCVCLERLMRFMASEQVRDPILLTLLHIQINLSNTRTTQNPSTTWHMAMEIPRRAPSYTKKTTIYSTKRQPPYYGHLGGGAGCVHQTTTTTKNPSSLS